MKTISVQIQAPNGAQFLNVDNDNHIVKFYKYQKENWYMFDTDSCEWYITTRTPTEPLSAIT